MMDRRIYFSLGAGLLVLMTEPVIPEYRWAIFAVAIVYFAFAALFALANVSAKREAERNGHL